MRLNFTRRLPADYVLTLLSARPTRAHRRPRGDRYSPSGDTYVSQCFEDEEEANRRSGSTTAKLRVENLHYDITETDLEVGCIVFAMDFIR